MSLHKIKTHNFWRYYNLYPFLFILFETYRLWWSWRLKALKCSIGKTSSDRKLVAFVKFNAQRCHVNVKEFGFRSTLCTYRLNACARRTSRGWRDEWDVIAAIQTQGSKFESWRSETEDATSLSHGGYPTILNLYDMSGEETFASLKPECLQSGTGARNLRISRQPAFTTAPVAPVLLRCGNMAQQHHIFETYIFLWNWLHKYWLKKNSVVDDGDLLVLDRLIDFCRKLNKMIIIIKAIILIFSDKNNPNHNYV